VANDRVVDYEVILGCTILGLLFLSQSFGSSKIGFLFGPIMLVWFGFIGGTSHQHRCRNQAVASMCIRTHPRRP
jgi:K+ transporter